jgi:hypothetical protein
VFGWRGTRGEESPSRIEISAISKKRAILSTLNSLCDLVIHCQLKEVFRQGETDMSENGKKNKGKREDRKKAKLNPKEKRKLKNEKKKKSNTFMPS